MKFQWKAISHLPAQTWFKVFAVAGLLLFLNSARMGLNLLSFTDETEKFVAAQMIDSGYRLYNTVFAHHGPLNYIIAHLYTQLISVHNFSGIRVVMVLLALAATLAIYRSPALKSDNHRLLSVGIYLFLLNSIWLLQGFHIILYQQVAGLLFSVAIAQLFMPLLAGETPSKSGIFWSAFCLVAMCFAAYSLGPSVVLLTVAVISLYLANRADCSYRRLATNFIAGSLTALALILVWMWLFADLKGYFIYHFYFNQEIYSQFINFEISNIFRLFSFSTYPAGLVHSFTISFFIMSFLSLIRLSFVGVKGKCVVFSLAGVLLLFPAVVLLDPRGSLGFQENTLIIVVLAITAMSVPLLVKGTVYNNSASTDKFLFVIAILITGILYALSLNALSTPTGVKKSQISNSKSHLNVLDDPLYQFVRRTAHGERVLTLIFNPEFYIRSGLLPASGNYYYLPWQAKYNQNPVDGYRIDLCHDIVTNKPALIYFNHRPVWGFSLPEYEPCFKQVLKSHYVYAGESIYLRDDLVSELHQPDQHTKTELLASEKLGPLAPISLKFTDIYQASDKKIVGIGVRFATHGRRNPGEAELRLKRFDGNELNIPFSLSMLTDNRYYYFDVPEDRYLSAVVNSVTGSSVSVWESHPEKGRVLSCISYAYSDGSFGYTAGCPLY